MCCMHSYVKDGRWNIFHGCWRSGSQCFRSGSAIWSESGSFHCRVWIHTSSRFLCHQLREHVATCAQASLEAYNLVCTNLASPWKPWKQCGPWRPRATLKPVGNIACLRRRKDAKQQTDCEPLTMTLPRRLTWIRTVPSARWSKWTRRKKRWSGGKGPVVARRPGRLRIRKLLLLWNSVRKQKVNRRQRNLSAKCYTKLEWVIFVVVQIRKSLKILTYDSWAFGWLAVHMLGAPWWCNQTRPSPKGLVGFLINNYSALLIFVQAQSLFRSYKTITHGRCPIELFRTNANAYCSMLIFVRKRRAPLADFCA